MIDLEKLIEESDMLNVLDYFGEEMINKGGKVCIRCPEHMKRLGKEDATIGNCVVTGNRYYCYACGASNNTFGYVRAKVHGGFRDATNLLAKINGFTVDRYVIDNENYDNNEIKAPFPLTSLDTQLLNVYKNVIEDVSENILYQKEVCHDDRKVLPKIHYFAFNNEKENNDKKLEIVYETGYTIKKSLIQLYESDPDAFNFFIKGKIMEAQAEIAACIDSQLITRFFKNKHFELKAERELRKNLKELNKLALKFGLPEVNTQT